MIKATRLPLHPRPLPYEALSSWVDRLAAAYDLERYEFLRAMFGVDPSPDTADSGWWPAARSYRHIC